MDFEGFHVAVDISLLNSERMEYDSGSITPHIHPLNGQIPISPRIFFATRFWTRPCCGFEVAPGAKLRRAVGITLSTRVGLQCLSFRGIPVAQKYIHHAHPLYWHVTSSTRYLVLGAERFAYSPVIPCYVWCTAYRYFENFTVVLR